MFLSCWFQFVALKLYMLGTDPQPVKENYCNYFYLLFYESHVAQGGAVECSGFLSWWSPRLGPLNVRLLTEALPFRVPLGWRIRRRGQHLSFRTLHLPQMPEAAWLLRTLILPDKTFTLSPMTKTCCYDSFICRVYLQTDDKHHDLSCPSVKYWSYSNSAK